MNNLSAKTLKTVEDFGLQNCIRCFNIWDEGNGTSTIKEGTGWTAKEVNKMIDAGEEIKKAFQ